MRSPVVADGPAAADVTGGRSVAFAPGRVNLIGEHTDYNQGLALPFAITEGVVVRALGTSDAVVRVLARDLGERDEVSLGEPGRPDSERARGGWRAYVRGIVAELLATGLDLPGAELEISGTVPAGAGLSSSAALELALALALRALAGEPPPCTGADRIALARLCSRVENEWVGAQTGLLDQLASLFGAEGMALRIDFRSLEVEQVTLALGDWRLVTLDSGEPHALAESGYNRRRTECAEACAALGIGSLRDATLGMLGELHDETLAARARHVITENDRVRRAVTALQDGDLPELGRLLDASHASLRDDYDVSTAAVERAVAVLLEAGAAGARVIGGGFGGHVLGLMPPGVSAPEGAFAVRPGPGARLLQARREG